MRLPGKQFILYGSRSDVFTIYGIGCIHLGNEGAAVERARQDIGKIRDDPNAFWLCLGDYAEFISFTDKRFDPLCVARSIRIKDLANLGSVLTEEARELFAPIAHKCLGIGIGNHERKYAKHYEQVDKHAWLCESLGVPNLGYCSMFPLLFCRTTRKAPLLSRVPPKATRTTKTFVIFTHHGAGYSQTPGGKINKLHQAMDRFNADIFFLAHLHDKKADHAVELELDHAGENVRQRERKAVMVGTYLRTYTKDVSGYGEERMYAPTPFGPGIIRIYPECRHVEAVV